VHAHVHFHQYAQQDSSGPSSLREFLHIMCIIHRNDEICMSGQTHQPGNLARTHDLIGNQDIADTTFDHDLGFPQFGAGDANRASRKLFVSNDRGFVSLGMGAQFRR
jgi:hypothetical protein